MSAPFPASVRVDYETHISSDCWACGRVCLTGGGESSQGIVLTEARFITGLPYCRTIWHARARMRAGLQPPLPIPDSRRFRSPSTPAGFEELFPFMPVDMLAASLVAGACAHACDRHVCVCVCVCACV